MLEYIRDTVTIFSIKLQFIIAYFFAITLLNLAITRRLRANWPSRLRESGRLNIIFVAFNTATVMVPVLAVAVTAVSLQSVPYLTPFVWDDLPWLARALAAF